MQILNITPTIRPSKSLTTKMFPAMVYCGAIGSQGASVTYMKLRATQYTMYIYEQHVGSSESKIIRMVKRPIVVEPPMVYLGYVGSSEVSVKRMVKRTIVVQPPMVYLGKVGSSSASVNRMVKRVIVVNARPNLGIVGSDKVSVLRMVRSRI